MMTIPDLLPESLRGQWCIAGGYAACPALASDIDVWVYNAADALADLAAGQKLRLEFTFKTVDA